MKIVITGGTGLIGRNLIEALENESHEITVFTRSPEKAKSIVPNCKNYIKWNFDQKEGEWTEYVKQADAVIYLAGESIVGKRWTKQQKYLIRNSRIDGTQNIVNVIKNSDTNVKIFISGSAIGYYGYQSSTKVTESDEAGNDFLARLIDELEGVSKCLEEKNIRRVLIRTGIVLSENGGALDKMLTPFKLFAGGPIGNGKQGFPWIHIDDIVGLFNWALKNEKVRGPLNASAPETLNNKEFSKKLGKVLNRPAFFYVPKKIIKVIMGEAADSVLNVAKVYPQKAVELGYDFKFQNAEEALKNVLNK